MLARLRRKRNPSALLVGLQVGATTVGTVWSFLKKLKMELPFDPVIPLLGIYPKKQKLQSERIYTPMFIAAQFTIARIWKQPRCPSADDWIRKLWYIHTMEYYAAIKKKELSSFAATWM